jgi:enamine deaminase RidA (YjgF/YER057c/UK114 family)
LAALHISLSTPRPPVAPFAPCVHASAGDLERVERLVKLLVLVNSAPTFTEHHLVANGASELLAEIFRNQQAFAQLPFGSCVEIEMIAEVRS